MPVEFFCCGEKRQASEPHLRQRLLVLDTIFFQHRLVIAPNDNVNVDLGGSGKRGCVSEAREKVQCGTQWGMRARPHRLVRNRREGVAKAELILAVLCTVHSSKGW